MAKRNGLPQLGRSDQRRAALPGVAWILSSSSGMACERRATAACCEPEPKVVAAGSAEAAVGAPAWAERSRVDLGCT